MKILVLQGPNLNLLGTREPDVYGHATLADVQANLDALAGELGVALTHVQSNHEGVLVDAVHDAWRAQFRGAIVNAGALTHTSIALRDAFSATRLPFVEVHVSNVYAREPFRHHSMLAGVAVGGVVGLGVVGYELALRGLVAHLGRGTTQG
jgi:3-dehydroquinate dehydratase-2